MNPNKERMLAFMPATKVQMIKKLGLSRTQVLRAMVEIGKGTHVGGWMLSTHGKPMAIYHAGEGVDVPCPQPWECQPNDERSSTNAPVRRDPMHEFLFGPPKRREDEEQD